MNTDKTPDLKREADSKLILKEETQKIIGHAFDVLSETGHGLHEKIYENSLTVAFNQSSIAFDQQRRFPVVFRGVEGGGIIPGLISFWTVIVDAQGIYRIIEHERGPMVNYLPITKAPG